MKRRDFLKKVGLVVCGVSSLGATGETHRRYTGQTPAGTTNNLFNNKVIEHCGTWLSQQPEIESVEVNGEKYFVYRIAAMSPYKGDHIIFELVINNDTTNTERTKNGDC